MNQANETAWSLNENTNSIAPRITQSETQSEP